MICPGLCSVTFRQLDIEALVSTAAQAGVKAIEWGGDKHVPPGDILTATRARKACEAHGIAPISYGSYVRAGTEGACDAFAPVLDSAEALGATNIRVWAGTSKRSETSRQVFESAARDLNHMAATAAKRDITVSVEYHRNSLTEEAADTVALLQAAKADNLFTYWQPVPGRGRDTWLDELDVLSPYLGYLHVFYWIMTPEGQQRRPMEEGVDDWRALLDRWTPSNAWPHPKRVFLEFVRDDETAQFERDMHQLTGLCASDASFNNSTKGRNIQ